MKPEQSQFTFDIMDAAGYGFYRVWKERVYLLKLATIPLLIKFASMVAVIALDLDNNLLRQGLVLLPSDFAKGWLMGQFLRTLLMNERWPVILHEMPKEAIMTKLLLRARGIVSAAIAFVLVAMVSNFILFMLFGNSPDEALQQIRQESANNPATQNAEQIEQDVTLNPLFYVPSVLGLLASFWSFRLLWVYVPFSVLMPISEYLKAVKGFMSSVKMMVLYFSCMAPVMLLALVFTRGIYSFFDVILDPDNMVARFFAILLNVSADMLVTLVVTAAMAWAMRAFLPKVEGAMEDLPKKV